MTAPFAYDAIGGRVVFGAGARAQLAAEVDALGATRVVVVADSSVDGLADLLGDRVVGRFGDVAQHVPAALAAKAVALVDEVGADGMVTIGGGSATGFGKAIRLERRVAFVAVPTTYAGSEMTTIWGRTEGDHKATGKHPSVKPDTVVYDPELTLTLPARVAGPSGMNALAHCVEALYGPGANPIVTLHALEGIRALHAGLPVVCSPADSLAARGDVLYGAYLAGIALASGGTALHHKTCHVLGGMFDLAHGDMNAVVLGHAVAYNAPAMPTVMTQLGAALGVAPAAVPGELYDLAVAIGAPTSLAEIGMPADGIAEAARRIVVEAAANVRPPDSASIEQFLNAAFRGDRPQ
ncbi:MAG TPA: maleylacetate reductase [Ilumatobacter sp.]|nr:maleylacetate reductase [Ilumatobacter sp.]